jgi:3-isopropylmalate/(R)-2-methylmalate dehydratase small subunit
MSEAITGRALRLGDDVNTDVLQPSRYFSLDPGTRAAGVLANAGEGGGAPVAGAILVAGRNFGIGSSREAVVRGLIEAGVRAVVCASAARIFQRNAINLGLPVYEAGAALEGEGFAEGEELVLEPARGRLRARHGGAEIALRPLDPYFAEVLAAGGLLAWHRGRA